jgi:hypothetical protein
LQPHFWWLRQNKDFADRLRKIYESADAEKKERKEIFDTLGVKPDQTGQVVNLHEYLESRDYNRKFMEWDP